MSSKLSKTKTSQKKPQSKNQEKQKKQEKKEKPHLEKPEKKEKPQLEKPKKQEKKEKKEKQEKPKKPHLEKHEKQEKKEKREKPKKQKEKLHLKPEKQKEKPFINLDNVNSFSITHPSNEYKLSESTDYILSICETNSDKYKVYFTSGEVESNMIILYSSINAYKKIRKIKPHLIISSTEHPSIIVTANSLLDSDQIELTIIKPNSY